jgi:hypothetical protein
LGGELDRYRHARERTIVRRLPPGSRNVWPSSNERGASEPEQHAKEEKTGVAEDAVTSEFLSAFQFPANREQYREYATLGRTDPATS